MKVTLLNPEQTKNIFKEWGTFACECYDTPVKYAERVGNKCYEDEHYSGGRTEYIKFKIEDVDRGIAEQIMRHEIGVRQTGVNEYTYDENPNNIVKNMKSFRYVDMNNFDFTVPKNIQNIPEAKEQYISLMGYINLIRNRIKDILINHGINEKRAVEDSNYTLPRATNTSLCIAFTLEALIHYMHKRLCTNTQDFHRDLAQLMKNEVIKIQPNFKDRLVPQCEYLLWCPETHRCCGRKPTKIELINKINEVNK